MASIPSNRPKPSLQRSSPHTHATTASTLTCSVLSPSQPLHAREVAILQISGHILCVLRSPRTLKRRWAIVSPAPACQPHLDRLPSLRYLLPVHRSGVDLADFPARRRRSHVGSLNLAGDKIRHLFGLEWIPRWRIAHSAGSYFYTPHFRDSPHMDRHVAP